MRLEYNWSPDWYRSRHMSSCSISSSLYLDEKIVHLWSWLTTENDSSSHDEEARCLERMGEVFCGCRVLQQ